MPKYFCDYCDVYLTHDSMSVRKAHNSGRNHLRNVVDYYQQIGQEKAQSVIDSITSSYADAGQAGNNPMNNMAPGVMAPGMGGFGGAPPGMGVMPPGMPPGMIPGMGGPVGGPSFPGAPPAGMPPMPFGRGMPPLLPGFPAPPNGFPPGFSPANMPPYPPPVPGSAGPAGSPPSGMPFQPPQMPYVPGGPSPAPGMHAPPGMSQMRQDSR